ncbi:MAG: DUF3450 family protein, partial [Pseudomonadota bacterium]
IETLRTALSREAEQLPLSERYRLIIETYQDELAEGTTQETWKEEIDLNGAPTEVVLYRYGRAALVYLSADRRSAGRWDRESGTWQPVGGAARNDIAKAIRIQEGREQQSVLTAPVVKYSVQ